MRQTARLVPPGLAMIAVAYGLARYAYGLFLPELRGSFALDGFALGLIGAGSYAGYCVAIVVSLVFTARVGPRSMAVAAGAVAVVGTALIAVAPAAPLLAAGVLVAGLSSGLASPPMGEAVARTVVPAKQNRANAQTSPLIPRRMRATGLAVTEPSARSAGGSSAATRSRNGDTTTPRRAMRLARSRPPGNAPTGRNPTASCGPTPVVVPVLLACRTPWTGFC